MAPSQLPAGASHACSQPLPPTPHPVSNVCAHCSLHCAAPSRPPPQAIGKRLLEARIDQLRGVVTVARCPPRTFGQDQVGGSAPRWGAAGRHCCAMVPAPATAAPWLPLNCYSAPLACLSSPHQWLELQGQLAAWGETVRGAAAAAGDAKSVLQPVRA